MSENPVVKAILDRRSIRAYTDQPVSDADLKTILNAGMNAPSAVNFQPWHVVTINDSALLAEMAQAFLDWSRTPEGGRDFADDYTLHYNAPAVLFVCGETSREFHGFDCGLLTQNMALAAQSLGLGTLIVGQWGHLLNHETLGAPYREKLGIPDGYRVWIGLSVGYAADAPDAKPRDPQRFTGNVTP